MHMFQKKDKDVLKCRPVIACVDHPSRNTMRVLAKGGTLILKLLSHVTQIKHFDLHDVPRPAVLMFDDDPENEDKYLAAFGIKQMFTDLSHEVLLNDTLDLIKYAEARYRGRNTMYCVLKAKAGRSYIGKAPCGKSCYHATFRDVYAGLQYELQHVHFTVGDVVLQHVKGARIGEIMSPFGAKSTCIMHESKWRRAVSRRLNRPITIGRIMDDSGLKYHLMDEGKRLLFEFGCYDAGCTLEHDVARCKSIKYIGCEVKIVSGYGGSCCQQKPRVYITNVQLKHPRYPHWASEFRMSVKLGAILGQTIYMIRVTSAEGYAYLYDPIWVFVKELELSGYPWAMVYRNFRHLHVCRLPVKQEGAE
jgi:hypothetical protein